ncbi:hypothetical protein EP7_002012 [Isosphaeraceae bacterium EP7]
MADGEMIDRLDRIEQMLASLLERESVKEHYSTDEFARAVGKAEFAVRQWCRLGRVHAGKRGSGRSASKSWAISHDELLRYRRNGLLPERRGQRWQVESTFQEARAHLGLETTRGRCRKTVERAAPCLFELYSVVALLFHALPRRREPGR